MNKKQVSKLLIGIYRIHWKKDGGTSIAAVGATFNGGRWLAPLNWVEPTTHQNLWRLVDHVELVGIKEPKPTP